MNRLAIDGDVLLYQAASAVERVERFDEHLYILWSDLRPAQEVFQAQLVDIQKRTEIQDYVLCFSDARDNLFRRKVYPKYKQNRTARKPLVFGDLLAWAMETHPWRILPGCEADDTMGILSHDHVLVSIDKDMKTVPGFHFNPDKDIEIRSVDPADAQRTLVIQTLTGDSTDGYPGLPKVGPKTAEALLKKYQDDTSWETVQRIYAAHGFPLEYARQMAWCARILKPEDWDEEAEVPKEVW